MWRDGEKGACVNQKERERVRRRRREVVGGSGPYREAGTTLASAILSARDIHNHLVLLALSRGARVLLFVSSLLDVLFHEERRFAKGKGREGEREKERNSRKRPLSRLRPLLSSLLVTDSLDFLLLPPDSVL